MKNMLALWLSCLSLVSFQIAQAQVPQGFKYQSVARNASGSLLVNANIGIRISIRDQSASGQIVYRETNIALTNSLGLFSITVGQGSATTGTFASIAWGSGSKFLEVEVDFSGGTNYVSMGVSQLQSVPYALYAGGGNVGWGLNGTAGTVDGTNFIGTTDDVPLNIRVNNQKSGRIDPGLATANTFFGYEAGFNTTGVFNTAFGYNSLLKNTTGSSNTANGFYSLFGNITGISNTAIGSNSLVKNSTGDSNTAIGESALYSNTSGKNNTAIGNYALLTSSLSSNGTAIGTRALAYYDNPVAGSENTNVAIGYESLTSATVSSPQGHDNTATGYQSLHINGLGWGNVSNGFKSLYSNTNGTLNTATGWNALYSNTIGSTNTASGSKALYANTSGGGNTATGGAALGVNTTGSSNTAFGLNALAANVAGSNGTAIGAYAMEYANSSSTEFINTNVAVGYQAMRGPTNASANTGNGNTATGYQALLNNSTGSQNTANGYQALSSNTTGNFNTAFGNGAGVSSGSLTNTTAIGASAVANASNKVRIGGTTVTVIEGQVAFTAASDYRLKKDIKGLEGGLGFILRLKPVSYRMKDDTDQKTNWGFIAQDIEKLAGTENAILTIGGDTARTLGLRYTDFVAPLVQAVQEQQKMIEGFRKEISELENQVNDKQAALGKLETENELLKIEFDNRLKRLELLLGTPPTLSRSKP